MTYSERELEFTFAKNRFGLRLAKVIVKNTISHFYGSLCIFDYYFYESKYHIIYVYHLMVALQ